MRIDKPMTLADARVTFENYKATARLGAQALQIRRGQHVVESWVVTALG